MLLKIFLQMCHCGTLCVSNTRKVISVPVPTAKLRVMHLALVNSRRECAAVRSQCAPFDPAETVCLAYGKKVLRFRKI